MTWFALRWAPNKKEKQETPIEIQIQEQKTSKLSGGARKKGGGREAVKFSKLDLSLGGYETATSSEGSGGNGGQQDLAMGWGEGGKNFERVADFSIMNHLYERVDNYLFYPRVLAQHQISGFVKTRLVFNKQGNCDWHKSTIQANDNHLRVYIFSVLRDVCRQNYARFLHGKEWLVVDMSFSFQITEHNDRFLKQKRILGNVLLFYRNSQQSIAQWRLGPFTGMFPIPFVALDLPWLADHWDQYMNGTDPMKEYKE